MISNGVNIKSGSGGNRWKDLSRFCENAFSREALCSGENLLFFFFLRSLNDEKVRFARELFPCTDRLN